MKIIECPRDAMQGLKDFIPTETKIRYINQLLRVGFDTLDFGSFVSSKVIPQMRDTVEVLKQLDLSQTQSKLLAIVPNRHGASQAAEFVEIDYLGYPLSVSETFQLRNTHKNLRQSLEAVEDMQEICLRTDKHLLVYLSMGFGNPYGDPYSPEILEEFTEKLDQIGIKTIQIADTIGVSEPQLIREVFQNLLTKFPHIEFGAHFHSAYYSANEKVKAALDVGCRRFDSAIGGYGGCPMAKDELTGNITTEQMTQLFLSENLALGLDFEAFSECIQMSRQIFP